MIYVSNEIILTPEHRINRHETGFKSNPNERVNKNLIQSTCKGKANGHINIRINVMQIYGFNTCHHNRHVLNTYMY